MVATSVSQPRTAARTRARAHRRRSREAQMRRLICATAIGRAASWRLPAARASAPATTSRPDEGSVASHGGVVAVGQDRGWQPPACRADLARRDVRQAGRPARDPASARSQRVDDVLFTAAINDPHDRAPPSGRRSRGDRRSSDASLRRARNSSSFTLPVLTPSVSAISACAWPWRVGQPQQRPLARPEPAHRAPEIGALRRRFGKVGAGRGRLA